jgi:hypothetical protein
VAITAVSLAKVAVVDLVRLTGEQSVAGIIMALGHCLGVGPQWLRRVLFNKFQLLRGSVCYANRILG